VIALATLKAGYRDWRKSLLGLNYQNGAVVSVGLAVVLLITAWLTSAAGAAAAGLGAMCTSIADTPTSPTRHKPVELAVALAGGTVISLLVGLAQPYLWTTVIAVTGLSFLTALMHGFGRKAIPVSFGLLLPLVLTLGTPLPDARATLQHASLFGLGGLLYVMWALPVARLLEWRTRRLALAEALSAFAAYQYARADMFNEGDNDADAAIKRLIQREDALVEALQSARELLFRQMRGPREIRLAAALVVLLDVYETVLSIHANAETLRLGLRDDTLLALVALVRDIADAAERQALALQRGEPAPEENFNATLARLRDMLEAKDATPAGDDVEIRRRANQRAAFNKLGHASAMLLRMQEMLIDDEAARSTLGTINLRAFLQPARYNFSVLRAQLHAKSPILRFAVRFTLAMLSGLIVAKTLPYSMHGSWVMLTIAVTMRANYAMSSQRRTDRVLGDLLGCLFAAGLLRLAPHAVPLVGVICVGLTRVYAITNYQISSMAGCIMGLLLLHYLAPGSGLFIQQRVIDSVSGALIAWLFSRVLPHWEAHDMPRLVEGLKKATRNYADEALRFDEEPMRYRLARKGMTDAISLLSGALRRMLAEPKDHRLDIASLERLLGSANLLAAQFASAQVVLRRRQDEVQQQIPEGVVLQLALARARMLAALTGEASPPSHAEAAPIELPPFAKGLLAWLEQVEEEARRLDSAAAEVLAATPRA
jgi:uncharacterized membrane protein YccC